MFGSTSRRHFKEGDVIRKRVSEEERIKKWSNVQDYYKTCDLSCSKLTNWAETGLSSNRSKTPELSEVEERRRNLEVRRQQLKTLLDSEMERFKEEQKVFMSCELKPAINIEMKRKEEEATSREAELMLYHANSFMTPYQYNRQYRHLSKKAANCDQIEVLPTINCPSQPSTSEKGFNDAETTEYKLKFDSLEAEKAVIVMELEKLFEQIRLNDEEQAKLKSVEAELSDEILGVDTLFKELSIKEDCEIQSDATRYEQWKQKCASVQNDLIKAIHFVQKIRSYLEDNKTVTEFSDRLLQHERTLRESLKFESSGDRLKHLLEFQNTRRESNKKWFQVEMSRWEDQEKARIETQKSIYSEFQSLVKKRTSKNLDRMSELLENESQLLRQIQSLKDKKDACEEAQRQLPI